MKNFRAFADENYDYYELTENLGYNNSGYGIHKYLLPKGAIFVHDKHDQVHGSIADGCLTLCWTPEGNCYGCLGGEGLHLHAAFKRTSMFKLVKKGKSAMIAEVEHVIEDLEKKLEEAKEKLKEMRE